MSARHSIVAAAAAAVAVLAFAAPALAAPTVTTDTCVRSAEGLGGGAPITVTGAGFTPGSSITVAYASKVNPSPKFLTTATADATGAFTTQATPPPFNKSSTTKETFALAAADNVNPAAIAKTVFTQVRIGYELKPGKARPSSVVTHTARGFPTGTNVYIHYRYHGQTKKTVKLGKATGPCGIVSKRMAFLPVRPAHNGIWKLYIDGAKKYSASTPMQLSTGLTIFTRFR